MNPTAPGAPAPRQVRIFISSPGDVADERQLALNVLARLQGEKRFQDRVWIRSVSWDAPGVSVAMDATVNPQFSVEHAIGRPEDCDLVAVILWSRLGTPLPEKHRKPDDSLYDSGTEYEFESAVRANQERGAPRVRVYRRIDVAPVDLTAPDLESRFEQARRVSAFFDRFADERGAAVGGVNKYKGPSQFERLFECHVRDFLEERITTLEPAAPSRELETRAAPASWDKPPFPGLRSFTEAEAPIYFGRGADVDDLVACLGKPGVRFLGVTGASGCGKSSLVRAGLVPRLRAGSVHGSGDWLYLERMTPGALGNVPLLSLAAKLERHLTGDESAADLAERLTSDADAVAAIMPKVAGKHPAVLLFVDQFEELFADEIARKARDEFLRVLAAIAEHERARVVITVRGDFQHPCLEHPAFGSLLRRGEFYSLRAPDRGALRDMINGPARLVGASFEDGLDEVLVSDLCGSWQVPEPGALALLAYALEALWDARDQTSGVITRAAYEALGADAAGESSVPGAATGAGGPPSESAAVPLGGHVLSASGRNADEVEERRLLLTGVHAAIGKRAEAVFSELPASARAAFGAVFRELVHVTDSGTATRRRADEAQVCESPGAKELVEALAGRKARLLLHDAIEGRTMIEVAHEALFRSWARLREWIEAHTDDVHLLRQVQAAAVAWQRAGDERDPLHQPWPHEAQVLAYSALENLGMDRKSLNEPLRSFLRPEAEHLWEEVENPETDHDRRQEIGVRLARIGDHRYGVGVDANGTPQMDWVDIPAAKGPLMLEGDAGSFDVPAFRIARYPVTWAQYRAFLEAPDGYRDSRWWQDLVQEGEPGRQLRRLDNHPADNVSWHDAVAFTRWLHHRLGIPDGQMLRLPTEWEWQQAATGGDAGREYPWGEWQEGRANTYETGLGRTTAVGLYPLGRSPQDVPDMAGNVFEWCLNKHEPASDVDIGGSDSRVVRGGSWRSSRGYARCAFRNDHHPDGRSGLIGFRVVVSSPIP